VKEGVAEEGCDIYLLGNGRSKGVVVGAVPGCETGRRTLLSFGVFVS